MVTFYGSSVSLAYNKCLWPQSIYIYRHLWTFLSVSFQWSVLYSIWYSSHSKWDTTSNKDVPNDHKIIISFEFFPLHFVLPISSCIQQTPRHSWFIPKLITEDIGCVFLPYLHTLHSVSFYIFNNYFTINQVHISCFVNLSWGKHFRYTFRSIHVCMWDMYTLNQSLTFAWHLYRRAERD